jgi:hypothetical protein
VAVPVEDELRALHDGAREVVVERGIARDVVERAELAGGGVHVVERE